MSKNDSEQIGRHKITITDYSKIAYEGSTVTGRITDLNGKGIPKQRCYAWARLVDDKGYVIEKWAVKGVGNSDDNGKFTIKMFDLEINRPLRYNYEIAVNTSRKIPPPD